MLHAAGLPLPDVGKLLQICATLDQPGQYYPEELEELRDEACNSISPLGSTPLHFIALGQDVDMAKWLIDNGSTFRANDDGQTPLHWACKGGYLPMVELLVAHMRESSIKHKDNNNKDARQWAKEYGHHDIVTFLSPYKKQPKIRTILIKIKPVK
uniref:Uncharacterized protein n=1 Tax=Vannella robusta TaxID=1487602 RepID=A0A7S4I5H3_9EUKA|mmetsp:Transcript_20824/g.26339  ORF Transcript_20824/g.26339 Transcript_20824/m.26339 type:complete len:155 (+) Transcript_20824:35-499(+)